jgi:ribonuclease-3
VLSHSSWHDVRSESYERLEFLGDAILGAIVADELCRRHPEVDEGVLARLKAHIVSRRSCTVVARRLGFGARMLALGVERGREDAARLAATPTVLAALVEAAIGAIYLVHGWEVVRDGVVTSFDDRFAWAEESRLDPKTELQETLQRQGRSVQYVVVSDTGPAHAKHFESIAVVGGVELGRGAGRSKKDSEQEAARVALQHLDASRRR